MADTNDMPKIITRKEARDLGSKTYFTGEPCLHGHLAPRYVNGCACQRCNLAWKRSNPEKHKASNKAWNIANADRVTEKIAAWRAANPEKVREMKANYNDRHREKVRADSLAWYRANTKRASETNAVWVAANRDRKRKAKAAWLKANPDKRKEFHTKWRKAHPEAWTALVQRRRAAKMNAPGKHTTAEIRERLLDQNGLCANPYCRADLRTVRKALDHIVALVKGGSNSIDNLQWLCLHCNATKKDRNVDEWLESQRVKSTKK